MSGRHLIKTVQRLGPIQGWLEAHRDWHMWSCHLHQEFTRVQRRYKKRSERSTWDATVENGTTAFATAVPLLSGSSASSSSSWRNEVRRFLLEECAIEVLASGSRLMSKRGGAKLSSGFSCFFYLCSSVQNQVRRETLHGAEAQVQHRLAPARGLC